MLESFKKVLWTLLESSLLILLVLDIALAIHVGRSDGWEQGFYVGIPAYIVLSIFSPIILGLIGSFPGFVKNTVKGKINRGKKYQY